MPGVYPYLQKTGLGLFAGELIAVDGSKFKAQNSKKRNFTQAKLGKFIKVIDKEIDDYMAILDECDKSESRAKISPGKLREKIDYLRKRQEEHRGLLRDMEEQGQTQVSLTDPDAKMMMNNQRVEVCYNAQIAVDSKHKMIVEHEVLDTPADQNQLASMSIRAKETLGADNLEVLADKGYYSATDIKACTDAGLLPLVPRPARRPPKTDGFYAKDRFDYDQEKNVYICPAGQELTYSHKTRENGKTMLLYKGSQCKTCQLKPKCTRAECRIVTRWEHEHILDAMQARVESEREKFRQRQWLVEHPFGTMKRQFDQGYLLLRGFEKVRTEFSLTILVYNIKRAIQIMGIEALIAGVRAV